MPSSSASPRSPGLLIGVVGRPADGKTCLLLQLAAHQLSLGQEVEGFASIAGGRRARHVGASEYHLQFLARGEEMTWAVRDETLSPPYRLEWETFEFLLEWAGRLRGGLDVLILDEFGQLETRGDGLMPLWPAIKQARPHIVAVAVHHGCVEAIESKLGREFDVLIDASSPDALANLERACADYGEWTRIGLFGGTAGALEMTIGSAIHDAHVPLGGLTMCSLQSALMTFAGFGLTQPARVIWVPFIAAGLKAFSPTANRVRPMLAITIQGGLYGSAVQVFGWNIRGVALGGALIGIWSGLQGMALQYLLIGGELSRSYDFLSDWLERTTSLSAPALPIVAALSACIHAIVACGASVTAWLLRAPPQALQELIARERVRAPNILPAANRGWSGVWRGCLRWQFWVPLVAVVAIMIASGRPWESIACLVVRTTAVILVLTALLSLLRPAWFSNRLRRLGWWGPALAMERALDRGAGVAEPVTSE
ncbi:MAG TPA: hypothetical protein VHD32_06460 [Candidatus Didemnitutus sp.]|nr:hypothetical protein [Candidatus Didemnitutus sp.]